MLSSRQTPALNPRVDFEDHQCKGIDFQAIVGLQKYACHSTTPLSKTCLISSTKWDTHSTNGIQNTLGNGVRGIFTREHDPLQNYVPGYNGH